MSSSGSFDWHTDPELLLVLAKSGDSSALVRLLDRYRGPLQEQLQGQLGRRLRVKLDIEDLLQDVSLEVFRDISRFRGSTESQFRRWLSKILAAVLMNHIRRYCGTQGRDVRRERRIAGVDDSTRGLVRELAAPDTSPSQRAVKHERASRLAEAIETLSAPYREVIVLRHAKGLSFGAVAEQMGRTEDSVKNLWFRALRQLRCLLENLE